MRNLAIFAWYAKYAPHVLQGFAGTLIYEPASEKTPALAEALVKVEAEIYERVKSLYGVG